MRNLVVLLICLGASSAHAVCLNPFGCEPKSLSECERQAAREARTEYAAKVQMANCRAKFPSVSEAMCKADSKEWAERKRMLGGRDAIYTNLNAPTDECKKWYPALYDDKLWLSKDVCVTTTKRQIAYQNRKFSKDSSGLDYLSTASIAPQCMQWAQPYIEELCVAERAAFKRCGTIKPKNADQVCRLSSMCSDGK